VVALLATAAIVASLVTGIVISAYREIGIMKALGFTPLQVELVFAERPDRCPAMQGSHGSLPTGPGSMFATLFAVAGGARSRLRL
jgi:putative ABC transport system permease protein